MKICVDCVPCILRQSREAPRRFTNDSKVLTHIEKETERAVSNFDMAKTPPELGGVLNRIMSEALGVDDPYLKEKRHLNKVALELLEELRQLIATAINPFEASVRVVMAANIMDFGAPAGVVDGDLRQGFIDALDQPLALNGEKTIAKLFELSKSAHRILYIADNTGEIILDRLLIERLPNNTVTVAVRSGPAINDALIEDAQEAGLYEIADVIESGSALPGTPISETSKEFMDHFKSADIIISKGQGNYESMSDLDAPIFFLLTAKCHVVAEQLGCEVGDFVAHIDR